MIIRLLKMYENVYKMANSCLFFCKIIKIKCEFYTHKLYVYS